ncbi:MAG: GxxExxY protein [Candidatus Nomurabacteria bacterium]
MKITLDSPLSTLSRISPDHEAGLKKLNISNILELLHHFPIRYADMREISGTSTLVAGQPFTVYGVMEKVSVRRSFKGHMPMTEARVADNTGTIRCVWFNQAYIGKMYPDGTKVKISGVVHSDSKGFLLSNPNIERAEGVIPESQESLFAPNADTNFLTPVYRETKGVSSLYLYTLIKKAIQANVLDDIVDPIPSHVLKKLHLPELREALLYIHFPKNEALTIAARKRFAFEEIFSLQLKQYQEKVEAKHSLAYPIVVNKTDIKKFIDSFPFKPTEAQMDAINSILKDLSRKEPMGRLLEGDVGSGKTFVAATVTYAVLQNSAEKNGLTTPKSETKAGQPLQIAYMAPTEILAKQHFESFIKYFEGTGIEIGLLTGSGCAKFPSKSDTSTSTPVSRAQLLSWLADGRVSIVIGTHALIQKSVSFQNLALIIIDEQHRFGVRQRKALARRNNAETSGTDAEEIPTDNLLYRDLTYKIREAIFTVKKELGSGHKEVVYQRSLAEEFTKREIKFDREKQIPIFYNKKKVGIYQPDFVVENSVIVELKTVPRITAIEKKQLWNYLKGSEYKLGLLVNFGHIELEIERVIYDTARSLSASVPQHSASLPHLLSMTATPIPRTLALTIFGDLDLTVIDSMPLERKKIITEIVPARGRTETYEKIRKELQAGRQVYVICPRIDEQDEEERQKRILKSVKEEAQRLADVIFPEFIVDILHSKMKKEEKEEVMQDFLDKKSDILVATSVIEVGINVPNATVIIIEHADRFGLAQLHQLRGRVGRREYQSYCYLFTESEGEITQKRLKALVNAKNGFELAEQDMLARGIGALMDGKQWGISDLAMEAIKNPKLVEIARDEAKELLDNNPTLEKYPELAEIIRKRTQVHME